MKLRLLTLVQCASPALAGRYLLSKRPIPSKLNAYHLATLTLHGRRLGPSRRTYLFYFLYRNNICSKTYMVLLLGFEPRYL